MGNKTSSKTNPLKSKKVKLLELQPSKLKIADEEHLNQLKHKWRKLKGKKTISSSRKLELIREAVPGLKILYEPLKTFYSIDRVLMSSNFGAISKAYCKQDLDTEVMVKVINLENVTSHLFLAIQGIVQLTKIDHPNVWKIRHVLFDCDKLYFILDFNNYMALSDYVIDNEKLSEEQTIKVVRQLLEVVEYLNERNICHRDLRPENILINPDSLEIMLPNFEFSSFYEESKALKTKLGSPYYMAPEISSKNYGKEWDIWSIGCIAYYWLTGYPPFLADTPNRVHEQIEEFKLNLISEDWENRSLESLAFIRNALTTQPTLRLKVEEALTHPWISADFKCPVGANPQDMGFDFDEKTFDIFIREIFAILIENFDVGLLTSIKDLIDSKNTEIAKEIIVNDVLNIIENTDAYDEEIKELLKYGLKQLDSHVDCSEFLETAIEEKRHLEQPRFDPDFVFSNSSNTTNTSNTEEESTSLEQDFKIITQ